VPNGNGMFVESLIKFVSVVKIGNASLSWADSDMRAWWKGRAKFDVLFKLESNDGVQSIFGYKVH
jgi:hypothetical protein